MVEDEEDSIGRRLPTTVEAADAVFMEENVDQECGDAVPGVQLGDVLGKCVFFFFGQGVRGDFEGPPRHGEIGLGLLVKFGLRI